MDFEGVGVGDGIQNQTSPNFRFPEVGISECVQNVYDLMFDP